MQPRNPADPEELGGIALAGRLGEGGMGTVYYGVTEDGTPVAVKTIRDAQLGKAEARSRFEREILALGMVHGPRIAALIANCEPGEMPPWFAVEYIRGLTLKEYVEDKGPLSAPMGAALGLLLAEALSAIHQVALLHRDFKPANIILGRDGPIVIDFGLVGLLDEAGDITTTGERLGTPACMAPEQANSARDLPPATDVYALGATLTFALTGHYLYQRPTSQLLLAAIADANAAPDLSGLPDQMREPIEAMLAYDPEARPSLPAVTQALAQVLADQGLTPAQEQRGLAALTYIERQSDPDTQAAPRRLRRRLPEDPHVPSQLVREIADSLRREYSTSAAF
jgi:eukaryotic-like serine/threonine-protein kinase